MDAKLPQLDPKGGQERKKRSAWRTAVRKGTGRKKVDRIRKGRRMRGQWRAWQKRREQVGIIRLHARARKNSRRARLGARAILKHGGAIG